MSFQIVFEYFLNKTLLLTTYSWYNSERGLQRTACNCGQHVIVVYLDDREDLRGDVDKRDEHMNRYMCMCVCVCVCVCVCK